jgi:hypothetical protein
MEWDQLGRETVDLWMVPWDKVHCSGWFRWAGVAVGSHLRVAEVSRVFPPVPPPAQRLLLPPKPAESDPLLTLLCRDLNAQKNYTELPRNVRIAVEMAFLEKKMSMATMTASL